MELERSFVKVPVELLNKTFRNANKIIEKEVAHVVRSVSELNGRKNTVQKAEAEKVIDSCITRLQGVKRKLEDTKREEMIYLQRLRARLQHLRSMSQDTSEWNSVRLNRMIIDYMLREGQYDAAIKLAEAVGITDYVDIDVFQACRKVIDALNKHDCGPALAWCHDNKSRLKRLQSPLEFQLRLQEYIELFRANRLSDAIQYARRHLASMVREEPEHLHALQEAMGLLAFRPETRIARYANLLSADRWKTLIENFKQDNYRLHSLPTEAPFVVALRTGLAVLKTRTCTAGNTPNSNQDNANASSSGPTPMQTDDAPSTQTDRNINCPTCDPTLHALAADLPMFTRTKTFLLCRMSGQPMDENNPPMVLPNGRVYSRNALVEQAAKNGGKVVCIATGQTFALEEAKKVYAMT